jgi:predicted RNA-binding Zn-ribbon protein involved in translation (DUF1610 family)
MSPGVPGGAMGAGGQCICVSCGARIAHRPGVPCREERCPACGKAMIREGSPHHQQIVERKASKRTFQPDDSSG